MAFLLPSIYKPFYINVLFVRQSYTEFFVIIDVYNGIGLYNKETEQYHIGDIHVTFEGVDGTQLNKTLNIYRDKPLFNTSYRESITTVFTSFTKDIISNIGRSKKLIIEYKSPDNEYGIKINRDITLNVNLEINDNGITTSVKPFYLKNIGDNRYNICNECGEINETLVERVKDKSNNFLYYVVNEGFYKYFIRPTCNYKSDSYIYESYNGEEVDTLNTDDTRINYDLNPYSVNYNDSNGGNFLPNENNYKKNGNYCITMPFFRMYPSIASYPTKKISPFAVRLTLYGDGDGDSIKLENDIEGYEVDEGKKFYLIGVKSPLTSLNENDYESEYKSGSSLRPEQDYVTFIEYISEIYDKTE